MRDLKSLQEMSSNDCTQCDREFTKENPCCCDESTVMVDGQELHLDGVCVACHIGQHRGQRQYDQQSLAGGTRERGE